MTKIAIIGGGRIGAALAGGLIRAGVPASSIHVANRRAERGRELKESLGVHPAADDVQAAEEADVVFICVKPKDTATVINDIRPVVDANDADTVIVSMAAGVALPNLEGECSAGTPFVRVMPNTPMLVGRGVSVVSRGRYASPDQLGRVVKLLSKVGRVEVVAEAQMDAATAVSGSGPAYLFLVAEAMIDAGVYLGLDRALATSLTAGTLEGAGAMLAAGQDPVTARANVTSPGGTTAAALRELEAHGLRAAFLEAMEACRDRAAELR